MNSRSTILLSSAIFGLTLGISGIRADDSAGWPLEKTLSAVPTPEVPRRVAQLIAEVHGADRQARCVEIVRKAGKVNPASAAPIVGAASRVAPEYSAQFAAAAASLQPRLAPAIAKAAAVSAPAH